MLAQDFKKKVCRFDARLKKSVATRQQGQTLTWVDALFVLFLCNESGSAGWKCWRKIVTRKDKSVEISGVVLYIVLLSRMW